MAKDGLYRTICDGCGMTAIKKRSDLCSYCDPKANKRSPIKEARVVSQLDEWASDSRIPRYTTWNKQNPLSDPVQCGRYRVDVNYDMDVFAVLLEIDEYQHSRYDKMCEFVRQGKIALSYGGKSVRFIDRKSVV